MAGSTGHDDSHASKRSAAGAGAGAHAHGPADEDNVRTPLWLPFVGMGLLAAGAVASYLWIYPGVRASTSSDGGTGDAAAETAAAPEAAPAAAQPAPPPSPGGGGH
jgi:hypothetical protein